MDNFVVICDSLRSLYNVGSIFRTADGAGVDKIYLCGITGRPDGPRAKRKISKVALGAEEIVKWEYVSQAWRLTDELKRGGYKIVSLEQTKNSVRYTDFTPTFPMALIVGNEKKGVRKSLLERSDEIIEIPMHGEKESLNVSAAFGVVACWIGGFKK